MRKSFKEQVKSKIRPLIEKRYEELEELYAHFSATLEPGHMTLQALDEQFEEVKMYEKFINKN